MDDTKQILEAIGALDEKFDRKLRACDGSGPQEKAG